MKDNNIPFSPEGDVTSLSFKDHMLACENMADEINTILRLRDFRMCEANAVVTWGGSVTLIRSSMTSAAGPKGQVPINGKLDLPLPWTQPSEKKPTVELILNSALAHLDKMFLEACSSRRVIRLGFPAYARTVSKTVVTATELPGNGQQPRIVSA